MIGPVVSGGLDDNCVDERDDERESEALWNTGGLANRGGLPVRGGGVNNEGEDTW